MKRSHTDFIEQQYGGKLGKPTSSKVVPVRFDKSPKRKDLFPDTHFACPLQEYIRVSEMTPNEWFLPLFDVCTCLILGHA